MKRQEYVGVAQGTLVAETDEGDWELYQLSSINGKWISFKLIRTAPSKKANYRFGFNGERLSTSEDVMLLYEHESETFEWLKRKLKEVYPSLIEGQKQKAIEILTV